MGSWISKYLSSRLPHDPSCCSWGCCICRVGKWRLRIAICLRISSGNDGHKEVLLVPFRLHMQRDRCNIPAMQNNKNQEAWLCNYIRWWEWTVCCCSLHLLHPPAEWYVQGVNLYHTLSLFPRYLLGLHHRRVCWHRQLFETWIWWAAQCLLLTPLPVFHFVVLKQIARLRI